METCTNEPLSPGSQDDFRAEFPDLSEPQARHLHSLLAAEYRAQLAETRGITELELHLGGVVLLEPEPTGQPANRL